MEDICPTAPPGTIADPHSLWLCFSGSPFRSRPNRDPEGSGEKQQKSEQLPDKTSEMSFFFEATVTIQKAWSEK